VCDSESDSENEELGDELTGMYTAEIPVDEKGRPVSSPYKLSTDHANALRMGERCSEEFKGSTIQASAAGFCEPTIQLSPEQARIPTPLNSDDEDSCATEDQKRAQASAKRRSAAHPRGLRAPSNPDGVGSPAQGKPTMTTRSQAKALPDEATGRAGGLATGSRSGPKGKPAAKGKSQSRFPDTTVGQKILGIMINEGDIDKCHLHFE
jgi:hypothetical protein